MSKMQVMNEVYFRRSNKILVPSGGINPDNFPLVASLDANLRGLGYALDNTLALALLSADRDFLKNLHRDLIAQAKEIKGLRRYRPMYPNFPVQVMEASDAELYINAIFHYFGDAVGLRILPVYDETKRPDLDFDEKRLTVVTAGDDLDFSRLVVALVQSTAAYSATDKVDILALGDIVFPVNNAVLPNRENRAFLGAESIRRGVTPPAPETATDVLRLAVALSDGDISLAAPTKFGNFTRPQRRALLGMLNGISSPVEDMFRNEAQWKRLGERLHPGEFQARFPAASAAFVDLRAGDKGTTFNSMVEAAIERADVERLNTLLVKRPGEFARRLDHVLRIAGNRQYEVLNAFAGVADKVSPTVLIQTRNALINRDGEQRVFFPKGQASKMQVIDDKRGAIRQNVLDLAVSLCEDGLITQFKGRGDFGGSYVDPALKGIAVPFGLRNASKAVKTLGRGSRLPLGSDTNIVRFFIWWMDGTYRTDIDLSAVCLGEDFRNVFDITYYNLREKGAVHSGDITSAPNGASEFIDIDVDRLLSQGVRYVAMTLYSYSGQDFADLPECFAGFMERKDLGSGEIYDPRTVTNKVDLTSTSKSATPFIFDLKTGEAIWVDLGMKVQAAGANAFNAKDVTKTVAQAMVELTPPSLYDLFSLHAQARGGLVSRDQAKTVFAMDGDVTPFDTETILADYL